MSATAITRRVSLVLNKNVSMCSCLLKQQNLQELVDRRARIRPGCEPFLACYSEPSNHATAANVEEAQIVIQSGEGAIRREEATQRELVRLATG